MAITFQVGFAATGDTLDKAIGSQIGIISKEIQKAFSAAPAAGLSQELANTVKQAQALELAIKKATTDKGISFYTLNNELRKAGTSAEEMVRVLATAGPEFSGSFNVALQTLTAADRTIVQIGAKVKEIQRVMTQSVKFTAAQTIQREIMKSVQASIGWVKELNSELAMISTVSGKTGRDLEKVYSTIIEGAKEMRVAASDYAEGSLIFYQQGLSDEEVQRRTEITIQSAKAAGASVEDMSKQLTSIWNTYSMVGDEQQRAASVGAKLAASTAVDFADIAEAMQTSAAAASQMGVSYDSLAAIIATVGDTTQQSASVIGNAYKTIFSRFQQLTTEGTDGEVTLNSVSSKLQSLGVNVLDASGQLRKLDDVIMETGQNWDNWSEKQQLAIAELVGGTRQYGQFLALMQNFGKYQDLLGTAQNEDGSTLETQFERAQDTIENAALNSQEAWKRAFSNIFDEDALKTFYKLSEDLGNTLDGIFKGFGGFEGILLMVASILSKQVIPKLYEGWNIVKDISKNRNYEAQGQQVKEEASRKREVVSTLKDGNYKDTQNAKIDTYEQAATAMVKINRIIASTNDLMKLQGEYMKDEVLKNQEILNTSLDELDVMLKKTEAAQADYDITIAKLQQEQNSPDLYQNLEIENKITEQRAEQARLASEMQKVEDAIKAERQNPLANVDNSKLNTVQQQQKAAHEERMRQLAAEKQSLQEQMSQVETQLRVFETANQMGAEAAKAEKQKQIDLIKTIKLYEQMAMIAAKGQKAGGLSQEEIDKMKNLVQQMNLGDDVKQQLVEGFDKLNEGGEITKIFSDFKGKLKEKLLVDGGELDGADQLIKMLDKISSAQLGLKSTTTQLENMDIRFNQLGMSAQQAAQMMTSGLMGVSGLVTGIMNIGDAISEGNIASVVSYFSMLGMYGKQAAEGVKLVRGALDLQRASAAALEVVKNKTLATDTLLQIAQRVGIQNAEKMTEAELKETLAKKGLNIVTNENSEIVAINATTWLSHPLFWIVAIIMAVVAAFTILNKIKQKNIEVTEKAIDKAKEEQSEMEELNRTIHDNSELLQENIATWKEARDAGEDTTKQYEKLTDTILSMNEALAKAGISQDRINEAMAQTLDSGKTTKYDALIKEADLLTKQNAITAGQTAMTEQKKLLKQKSGSYVSTTASSFTEKDREIINRNSGISINKNYDSNGVENGEYASTGISVETSSVAQLTQRYKDLAKAKIDAEKHGGSKELIKMIDDEMEKLGEFMDGAEETIASLRSDILSLYSDSVTESDYNFEQEGLINSLDYINQIRESLTMEYGDIFSTEEIESMVASITAADRELNKVYQTGEKIDQLANKFVKDSVVTETAKQITAGAEGQYDSAQALQSGDYGFSNIKTDYKAGKGGWSQFWTHRDDELKWYKENQSEKYNQMIKDLAEFTGKTEEELNSLSYDDLQREINTFAAESKKSLDELTESSEEVARALELEKQKKALTTFFNDLSGEERDLLLNAHLEFADTPEELQAVLDTRYHLMAKLGLEFKDDDDYLAQYDHADKVQTTLKSAIEEYKKDGKLAVSTTKELYDAGLGEYILRVGDDFKLSQGAINDWNGTTEEAQDAVEGLIDGIGSVLNPIRDFALTMGDLNATVDSDRMKGFTEELMSTAAEFASNEENATNYAKVLEYIGQIKDIAPDWVDIGQMEFGTDEASFNEAQQTVMILGEVQAQTAEIMRTSREALDAGKITMSEFNDIMVQGAETIQASYNRSVQTAKKQMEALQKEAGDVDLSLALPDDASDDLKRMKKQYDNLQGSIDDATASQADLNKEIGDLKKFQKYAENLEENYETLAGVLNNDFSLKIEAEDLTGDQIAAIADNIKSNMDNVFEGIDWTKPVDEIMGSIETVGGAAQSIVQRTAQQLGITEQQAIAKLKSLHNKAQSDMTSMTSEELQLYSAFTGATVYENGDVINSVSNAVGNMIDGVADIIENFDYDLKVTPTGGIGITTNATGVIDFAKKFFSGDLTIHPTGEGINFNISGSSNGTGMASGLEKIRNAANFLKNDGLGDALQLDDFSTKTEGDPTTIQDGIDGEVKDGNSGGSRGKEDEFKKIDNDDAEKETLERYENLTNALEEMSDMLDRIAGISDDAWGPYRVRQLKTYRAQLDQIAKTQKKLIEETKGYHITDRKALEDALAGTGIGLAFAGGEADKFGDLLNPGDVRNAIIEARNAALDRKNAAIDAYNAKGVNNDDEKDAIEKAYDDEIKLWDKREELLDQFLETHDLLRERIDEQVENLRDVVAKQVEEIKYKLEFRLTIDEREFDRLEQLVDRLGTAGIISAESMEVLGQEIKNLNHQQEAHIKAVGEYREMLEGLQDGDSDMTKKFIDQYGLDAYNIYMKNGGLPAEIMEALDEEADALVEGIEQMIDKLIEGLEGFMQQFEEFIKVFDKNEQILDKADARLDALQSVLDFKGTNYSTEAGRQAQRNIDDARINSVTVRGMNNRQKLTDMKQWLSGLQTQKGEIDSEVAAAKKAYETALEEARAMGYDANSAFVGSYTEAERLMYEKAVAQQNLYQENIDTYEQEIADLEVDIQQDITDLFDAANEKLEHEKEMATMKIGEVVGGIFNDIRDIADSYSTTYDWLHSNLDDYDKNYYLNDFQKQIDEAAENMDAEGLEKLADIQERINKYKEEGREMSQEEVDLIQKALDLEIARANFEDSRNAKNTMRLARDASGNYSYVYSDDGNNSDDADELARLEYEYKKAYEAIQDNASEAITNIAGQLYEEISNINYQMYMTDENYRRSIDAKIGMLWDQMKAAEQRALQTTEIMADGIKNYAYDFSASAGGIVTDSKSISEMFEKLSGALVGPNGYTPGATTNGGFYGDWMGAQEEVAETINISGGKIGEDFGLVEKVIGAQITTITGTHLKTLDTTMATTTKHIDENTVEIVGSFTECEQGIAKEVGPKTSTSPEQINGIINNLETNIVEMKTTHAKAIEDMLRGMSNWRINHNREIDLAIAKIKEYLQWIAKQRAAAAAELDNQEPDETQVVESGPGTPTTPTIGPASPSDDNGLSAAKSDAVLLAYSMGNWARDWYKYPNDSKVQTFKAHVGESLYNQAVEYAKTSEYRNNVGNGGWGRITKYGNSFAYWNNNHAKELRGFNTGGYTGNDEGLAILHEKELVLNAEDTKNILAAVAMMRQTVASQLGSLNTSLFASAAGISSLAQPPAQNETQTVDQQVRIEASFPGVSVAQEIEDALNSLITQAAQYNLKR